jgi:hypothetical protein
VREYGPAFNIIHVSAAITHLAQLSQRTGQQQQQQQQQQQVQPRSTQLELHLGGAAGVDNEQQVVGLGFITSQMAHQHAQLQQQLGQPNTAHQSPPHSEQQQQDALLARLLQQAMPQLQHAGSRQVANMLWALSVLQVPGDSSSSGSSWGGNHVSGGQPTPGVCMQRLMERAAQLFGSAEAQHLSNMALAAAKLQLPVSPDWLRQLTAAWLVLVRRQQGSARSSSSSSGGHGGGGSTAAEHNVAGLVVSSSDRQQRVSSAGGPGAAEQAASGAAAAAGAVPYTRGPGVISPQATCNLLWALVQLRHQPQQGWLQEVLAAAAHQLPSWPARNVAMLMWGCARLGYRCADSSSNERQQQQQGSAVPGQEQQQQQQLQDVAMLDALHRCAQGFSSRDLSQALWAAAVMGLHVPDSCLQLLLAAGQHTQQLSVSLQQQQQQQQGLQPRGEVGHSVSVLLWSLGQLRQGARCQLPPGTLQPWVVALAQHAVAAPGQSLGVGAWAAGQLGLVVTCPQLVLRLVQAAARRQHIAARQQQHAVLIGSSSGSTAGTDSQFVPELDVAASAAILWSAARCIVHAQKQQQQQQQQSSRPGLDPSGRTLGAWGSTGRQPPAAAAGRSQPAAAPGHHLQQPAASSSVSNLQWAIKAAATTVAMQLLQGQQVQAGQQQPSVWRLALVLWSSSVMQLPLPAPWWHQHLQQLQALLQVQTQPQMAQEQAQAHLQQQQQLQAQQQAQRQQVQQQCREHAQALAVSVWALGRARIRVPTPAVLQLQDASLALLQGGAFSQEGMVVLLLGFTRLATTAAAQFPRNTRLQRDGQQKRHRLLRARLHMRRRPGRRHNSRRQLQQQQWPGAGTPPPHLQQQRLDQECSWPVQHTAAGPQEQLKHQHQQQQQLGRQAARRSVWWRQHMRQQRGRVVFGAKLCQRQRHGWVAAAGLRAAWLQTYCTACCPCVPSLGHDGLVGVLWALGRLRFHPGRSFMTAAQHRAGQLLPGMGPRHMALLLWALARLNTPPGPQLGAALTADWEAQLASAGQADMQQVGWAQRQLQLLWEQQQQQHQHQQQGVCV